MWRSMRPNLPGGVIRSGITPDRLLASRTGRQSWQPATELGAELHRNSQRFDRFGSAKTAALFGHQGDKGSDVLANIRPCGGGPGPPVPPTSARGERWTPEERAWRQSPPFCPSSLLISNLFFKKKSKVEELLLT